MTAADYFQPFRIHYRVSILLCLKSTTGQCIIRVSEATGRRSFRNSSVTRAPSASPFSSLAEFPLVAASSSHPRRSSSLSPASLPRLVALPPSDKRRNAGGSVGIPEPSPLSHGDSHRLINQTPRTNRYGDPTAVLQAALLLLPLRLPLRPLTRLLASTRAQRLLTLVVYPRWDRVTSSGKKQRFLARLS